MSAKSGHPRPLFPLLVGAAAVVAGAAMARRYLDTVAVEGGSMVPTLLPGEWLVVESWTLGRRPPRPGEIVLAGDPRFPERELIKRVAARDDVCGTLALRGDAPEASTDSRAFGGVPMASVRWRAVLRYWPLQRFGLL